MKIKREILGAEVEIELTTSEVYDAHLEFQHEADMADMRQYMNTCFSDNDTDDTMVHIGGVSIQLGKLKKIMEKDDVVGEMAYKFREAFDEDAHISECMWETVETAVKSVLAGEVQKEPPEPKEVVRIQCWGDDDYDAYFPEQDYSVRGTFKQIIEELKEGF